ncbi:MAG: phosphoribosylaminoimidazolesuccinocarboxamide synthase [Acidobacteria bacterium]|nr:phosphoribosylaminoimidazolesuccinocarboxamide synthase [Acidobacteriota bacterium]MYA46563.1 phosphoribosylaminoimidazolesuccinocarboxamide synthase [Acidobacteriota bacterium]MYH21018.1 phosphoribosylaminoimidazolesuccinocarboxamide synthase [Acidobacteriota bacterium]MYI38059.1 phosphoribosylaminoimidazolesuccinocarboxamide synthase [Acidobacteriota bacterium]MYK80075.1 phosphoribosylaminoimidazolesuccinocarboxamide synthase [Acidobacteriota bacterium]
MAEAVLTTSLEGVALRSRGKVRDIYAVGDQLLLVTTDRVSAFDVVLPEGIPEKGRVLNSLSAWWLRRTEHIVPNHLVTDDVDEYPDVLAPAKGMLDGRSMLVRRLNPIPFECVMRGFLYGSGWKEYGREGSVCGISLPSGMQLAERFPEPLFTPATKAEDGHDENVSEDFMANALGRELTTRLHEISREIYASGVEWAAERGIIIADTKFEFGHDDDGKLYVIDEVLTPDSSRFWPADEYAPGKLQSSFDKQYVRDYLETVDWNKEPPAPHLPDSIVRGTTERFLSAYRQITGSPLPAPRY